MWLYHSCIALAHAVLRQRVEEFNAGNSEADDITPSKLRLYALGAKELPWFFSNTELETTNLEAPGTFNAVVSTSLMSYLPCLLRKLSCQDMVRA
jgi:hypothetical protein